MRRWRYSFEDVLHSKKKTVIDSLEQSEKRKNKTKSKTVAVLPRCSQLFRVGAANSNNGTKVSSAIM